MNIKNYDFGGKIFKIVFLDKLKFVQLVISMFLENQRI